mmetsp:Transcript_38144/g.82981  ORF Transcript_38144/g.82981 Transcript_38144/m.82981 type:complete len:210 (+) Transcript_38144:2762-3391(+)
MVLHPLRHRHHGGRLPLHHARLRHGSCERGRARQVAEGDLPRADALFRHHPDRAAPQPLQQGHGHHRHAAAARARAGPLHLCERDWRLHGDRHHLPLLLCLPGAHCRHLPQHPAALPSQRPRDAAPGEHNEVPHLQPLPGVAERRVGDPRLRGARAICRGEPRKDRLPQPCVVGDPRGHQPLARHPPRARGHARCPLHRAAGRVGRAWY